MCILLPVGRSFNGLVSFRMPRRYTTRRVVNIQYENVQSLEGNCRVYPAEKTFSFPSCDFFPFYDFSFLRSLSTGLGVPLASSFSSAHPRDSCLSMQLFASGLIFFVRPSLLLQSAAWLSLLSSFSFFLLVLLACTGVAASISSPASYM